MREIFEFLCVDSGYVPPKLQTRYQAGATAIRIDALRSPSDLQKKLVQKPGVRSLWRLVPHGAQRRVILALREANYRFDLWNKRRMVSEGLEASPEALARLRAHYEEDRMLLESLLERAVPWAGGGRADVKEISA